MAQSASKENGTKLQVDKVDDRIYLSGFTLGAKLSMISILMLFLGFFINFPLKEVITARITSALAMNRACPMSFKDLEFEWFLPKVKIKSLNLPSICFGGAGKNVELKNLSANFLGPSFSPLGLKLSHQFTLEGTKLTAYHALTPSGHVFKLEPTKISLNEVGDLLGQKMLAGDVTIDGRFDVDSRFTPKDVKFSANSSNLLVKNTNLQGFTVPRLDIGTLSLKGTMNSRQKLLIDELFLGNENSPIKGNFSGSVDLNKMNPNMNSYDLKGTLSFSNSFKASPEFGLINLFLNLDKQKTYEGSYKINVQGAAGAMPRISFD